MKGSYLLALLHLTLIVLPYCSEASPSRRRETCGDASHSSSKLSLEWTASHRA